MVGSLPGKLSAAVSCLKPLPQRLLVKTFNWYRLDYSRTIYLIIIIDLGGSKKWHGWLYWLAIFT
jgi:hypothetical protein